jgi:hypothetical protein
VNFGEKISREVLEFIEEALDQIAFAVERKIAIPFDLAVGLRRDNRSARQ